MAFTTVGGSGTTSNSTASGAGADLNLFTTPNTSNMLFLVTVIIAGGCAVGTADTAAVAGEASTADVAASSAAIFDSGVAPSGASNEFFVDGAGHVNSVGVTNYSPGRAGKPGFAGRPATTGKQGAIQHIKTIHMKVGPNTAVHVPVFNTDTATRTIYVSWNYCGVSF